ncbi:MAG: helix-turn-helix domain-containing protein [Tumebacillaceae bacterium]
MQEVGTELKRLREQKGLTLDDVQYGTKIRSRYLEAIEAGELEALPGIVYARGFIKSYAEFLGVNGQELLETYGVATQPVENVPVETMSRRSSNITKKPLRTSTFGGMNKLPQILAGVGVVAALVVIYVWIVDKPANETSKNQVKTQDVPKAVAQPVQTPAPVTPAPVTPPPAPKVVVKEQEKTNNKKVFGVTNAEALTMEVTTTDNCWLEVNADGKVIESGIMKKGETHSWKANTSLSLMTAKSNYMTVKVNGQPVTLENLLRGYTYSFLRKS